MTPKIRGAALAELLLYGATGATGKLVAERAAGGRIRPTLAGRDAVKLDRLASRLGLPWKAFTLDDPAVISRGLDGVDAVLNLAGPFSRTARPMLDACLDRRVSYIDITGEIAVLDMAARRHRDAVAAGITVLPGAGFDVVPSDCLAAHLKRRMPALRKLRLSIDIKSKASRGSLNTAVEALGRGTFVRRNDRVVELGKPPRAEVDFGDGVRPTIAISWGDVATAWHSTGAPNIEVHFVASPALRLVSRLPQPMRWALGKPTAQSLLKRLVSRMVPDPTADQRRDGSCRLLAEGWNVDGERVASVMVTPDPYILTAECALEIARRVGNREVVPDYVTPSMAFGADFALGFDRVTRMDLE